MNVDHFFTIGAGHITQGSPCEDYALSGRLPSGAVFGVVADGCSGANANTDVGARAISWAFKQTLEHQAGQDEPFGGDFSERLKQNFASLKYPGTSPEDYLATVVGFVSTPTRASVFIHGDGAVALLFADGRVQLLEYNWWDNTPFYLNYRLHAETLDRFLERFQDGVVEPFGEVKTTFKPSPDGVEILGAHRSRFSMDSVFNGHVLQFAPAEEGIVAIAVLTDGIEQVGEKPAVEVAKEFLAFKNHQGDFVKRRLLKALKEFRKEGAVPRDDVGIAAVWFSKGE